MYSVKTKSVLYEEKDKIIECEKEKTVQFTKYCEKGGGS